jgi:hypothetical protein
VLLGLALVVDSFTPWYRFAEPLKVTSGFGVPDYRGVSSWFSPHAPWVGVLLCLGAVAGHVSVGQSATRARWFTTFVAAFAVVFAAWGWLRDTFSGSALGQTAERSTYAWQLQDQGAETLSSAGPMHFGWGYLAGVLLIVAMFGIMVSTTRSFSIAEAGNDDV